MTREQVQLLSIIGVILAIGLVFTLPFLFHQSTPAPQSTFVLSPTAAPSPTAYVEPQILTWENYANDTYQFMTDYPSTWNKQEYRPNDKNGGVTVAFSPNNLPCSSCSYTTEGYYSVRVYNQSSDPIRYAQFVENRKKSENSRTDQKVVLDGVEGLLHGRSITLEHQGWIYELSLDQRSEKSILDSKIFVRAAQSFKFTTLKFIK